MPGWIEAANASKATSSRSVNEVRLRLAPRGKRLVTQDA